RVSILLNFKLRFMGNGIGTDRLSKRLTALRLGVVCCRYGFPCFILGDIGHAHCIGSVCLGFAGSSDCLVCVILRNIRQALCVSSFCLGFGGSGHRFVCVILGDTRHAHGIAGVCLGFAGSGHGLVCVILRT